MQLLDLGRQGAGSGGGRGAEVHCYGYIVFQRDRHLLHECGDYHSHCVYLGLLGDDKNRDALNTVMKYFQKLPLILYAGEREIIADINEFFRR